LDGGGAIRPCLENDDVLIADDGRLRLPCETTSARENTENEE
jgi:hypothetical protein